MSHPSEGQNTNSNEEIHAEAQSTLLFPIVQSTDVPLFNAPSLIDDELPSSQNMSIHAQNNSVSPPAGSYKQDDIQSNLNNTTKQNIVTSPTIKHTSPGKKHSISSPTSVTKHGDKKKGKMNFLKKKERVGMSVRGEHLSRLVRITKLNRQQILTISKHFKEIVPNGIMTMVEFTKALEFDKDDQFAVRLFLLFESEKGSGELSMDDFIVGVAFFAPDADINTKLDLCYSLFDVDGNGSVQLSEFREVTKYSMKMGRFGIAEEKLNHLIEHQWHLLDTSGDGEVSREEFVNVISQQKNFVNSLTIQVGWLQAVFKNKSAGHAHEREYAGSEPLENLIKDLSHGLNAGDEDANTWISILKRNLYFTVNSLTSVSAQDWSFMRLPNRLYAAVREEIDPSHQSSADVLLGRVKSNVAMSRKRDRFKLYIESNFWLLLFLSLYFLGSAAMLAHTLVKYLTDKIDPKFHNQSMLVGPSFIISRCAGALLKYNFSIFLFPICYRLLTWFRTTHFDVVLPIDFAMSFHRGVGAWILILALVHVGGHIVNARRLSTADPSLVQRYFGLTNVTQSAIHSSRSGVTGWIMIACIIIIVAFAIQKVRKQNFQLFFAVHHLYIPTILCLVLHDGLFSKIEIVYWMIPVISVFLIERFLTVSRAVPKYDVLNETKILKGDVLALVFEKPKWFNYAAGHYLWINCPSVSSSEWHPFTLTSSPDEPFLMVDINCTGDWTKKMQKLFTNALGNKPAKKGTEEEGRGKRGENGPITIEMDSDHLKQVDEANRSPQLSLTTDSMLPMPKREISLLPMLRLDGPYGTASGDVLLYTHVVLIGGGIGVTPFISILKSIRHAVLYTNNCPLHAVHFVWVTRNQENFNWFSMMLTELQQHEDMRGFLRVSIYLTASRHPINDVRLLGVSLLMNQAKEELGEDLITGLESQTHFGRPDFSEIMLQHNTEWAGNDVGVFFCGPEPLAQSIRVTCKAVNRANQVRGKNGKKPKGARFHFQQEHF